MRITPGPGARWTIPVILLALVSAEWLRTSTGGLAVGLGVTGIAVVVMLGRRADLRAWLLRGTVMILMGTVGWQTVRLDQVTRDWPVQRERLVARASLHLAEQLRDGAAPGRGGGSPEVAPRDHRVGEQTEGPHVARG